MKINYTFANGETSDVEVNEEIGNLILDSRREESNQDRKERYHCYSLDAAVYEGRDYSDGETPESALFLQLENQRIEEAFGKLSEVQQRRLLMAAEGAVPPGDRPPGRQRHQNHSGVHRRGPEKVFEVFLKSPPLKAPSQSPYVEGHTDTVLQKAEVMR